MLSAGGERRYASPQAGKAETKYLHALHAMHAGQEGLLSLRTKAVDLRQALRASWGPGAGPPQTGPSVYADVRIRTRTRARTRPGVGRGPIN